MPKFEVVWREHAEADLDGIFDFIAQQHGLPETAFRYTMRIKERCDLLADAPMSGRKRDEIRPGLRSVPFESVVILYVLEDRTVVITNVIHGARDYERLFRPRPARR